MTRRVEIQWKLFAIARSIAFQPCDSALHAPGKGSYGSVYEARVKDTEDRVAIKVIPVGENDDIEDIQKEIDMLKECDHPNVVHYLVMLDALHDMRPVSLPEPRTKASPYKHTWHIIAPCCMCWPERNSRHVREMQ